MRRKVTLAITEENRMAIDPETLMRHAIEAAQRGIHAQQSPFGCAIARGDEIVAACHNIVWQSTDITGHAEITALREACRKTDQVLLNDCVVATTCEPCPMCMAALHWARVQTVYYGATIADAGLSVKNLPLSSVAISLRSLRRCSVPSFVSVQSMAFCVR